MKRSRNTVNVKTQLAILGGAVAATAGTAIDAHADTVTVNAGDTTWGLAQSHGTTVDQIVNDNNLDYGGALIYAGQTLEINQVGQGSSDVADQSADQSAPVQTATQDTQDYSQAQSDQTQTAQTAQASQSNIQTTSNYTSNVTGDEAAAKDWIVQRESGGSYTARNGQYIGKYQLSANYLNGDWSPANQDRVADQYVAGRYGSWVNAKSFWQANGWY
ncbi:LysM peptidoglycan-binding domain-containing protein [Limosilactobacillus mucosae]|uniref:aggregation-promoting factor n=1 Tax=Limosilactobacillus mucosae TaxID=97478 RepID=UPI003993C5E9